jgi:hypothetical protein
MLHTCVSVCQRGGLFMVVMDRVHGEVAWQVDVRGKLLLYDNYEDIQDAVALLHSNNCVFGDRHTLNIMVFLSTLTGLGLMASGDTLLPWMIVYQTGSHQGSCDVTSWTRPMIS